MKEATLILASTILCLLVAQTVHAQDILKTNPEEAKLLQETPQSRMILITMPPGSVLKDHTHPPFLLYLLDGGTIEETYPDREMQKFDLSTGEHMQSEAEGVHADENTGTTTIRMLLVEFK